MNNNNIFYLIWLKFRKILEKKFLQSSVLALIRIRNRIRIEQKCWIRIRIKWIRIHNPVKYDLNNEN
jgi:hypothetical protein